MKRLQYILLILFFPVIVVNAQETITLKECHQWAMENNPLRDKEAILEQLSRVKNKITYLESFPKIEWNTQGTLQSETVDLPFDIPGAGDILDLPLYNFRTVIDASYSLYDGGSNKRKRALQTQSVELEKQQVKVELETLKQKVNEIYFGILFLQQERNLYLIALEDLKEKMGVVESGVKNGVILESELLNLRAENLKLQASIEENESNLKGLLGMLEELTGQQLSEEVELSWPETPEVLPEEIDRPEHILFELQKKQLTLQEDLLNAVRKPKAGVFLQSGLGYPNPLNFFDNELSFFATGGVRINWLITDFGKKDQEKEALTLQALLVENQKDVFDYNLNLQDEKERETIEHYRMRIEKDEEIVKLREEIESQASSQLKHGVITSSDYIVHHNAVLQAKLKLELHKLQLIRTRVDFLTRKGKF